MGRTYATYPVAESDLDHVFCNRNSHLGRPSMFRHVHRTLTYYLWRYSHRVQFLATMSLQYSTEKQVALAAVRRACALTSKVFDTLVKNETLTKGDKSPVTGEQRRQL